MKDERTSPMASVPLSLHWASLLPVNKRQLWIICDQQNMGWSKLITARSYETTDQEKNLGAVEGLYAFLSSSINLHIVNCREVNNMYIIFWKIIYRHVNTLPMKDIGTFLGPYKTSLCDHKSDIQYLHFLRKENMISRLTKMETGKVDF